MHIIKKRLPSLMYLLKCVTYFGIISKSKTQFDYLTALKTPQLTGPTKVL